MDERDHFWRRNKVTDKMELINQDTGLVVPQEQIAYHNQIAEGNTAAPGFSEILADEICQRIIEGGTITGVAKDPNFPDFYTISKWRKHHPEFDAAIQFAFQARADFQHDRMLATAEGISNKDEAATKKPLIDALKWSAEKTNPDQYGQKTKISGDKLAPLGFTILTGVPAPEEKDVTPSLAVAEDVGDDEVLSGGIEAGGDSETEVKDS